MHHFLVAGSLKSEQGTYICLAPREQPSSSVHIVQVEDLVLSELEKLKTKGFSSTAVEAALNSIEFDLRENNTGSFPRGLSLMLRSMSSWIYDKDPFQPLQWTDSLEHFKVLLASCLQAVFMTPAYCSCYCFALLQGHTKFWQGQTSWTERSVWIHPPFWQKVFCQSSTYCTLPVVCACVLLLSAAFTHMELVYSHGACQDKFHGSLHRAESLNMPVLLNVTCKFSIIRAMMMIIYSMHVRLCHQTHDEPHAQQPVATTTVAPLCSCQQVRQVQLCKPGCTC